jgi:hypothetical protein
VRRVAAELRRPPAGRRTCPGIGPPHRKSQSSQLGCRPAVPEWGWGGGGGHSTAARAGTTNAKENSQKKKKPTHTKARHRTMAGRPGALSRGGQTTRAVVKGSQRSSSERDTWHEPSCASGGRPWRPRGPTGDHRSSRASVIPRARPSRNIKGRPESRGMESGAKADRSDPAAHPSGKGAIMEEHRAPSSLPAFYESGRPHDPLIASKRRRLAPQRSSNRITAQFR